MKVFRHREHTGSTHPSNGNPTASSAAPTLSSHEKHYLVWGVLRLSLGLMQMIFAAAAILNLIFVGLTGAVLAYAAVSTVATLASRMLFRGRSRPPR